MNNFRVISKAFYPQYDNYNFSTSTWTLVGTSTDRLQGNVGEKLLLVEQIEVSTIINESKAINMKFIDNTSTCSLSSAFLNFTSEGLYSGASIEIDFNGSTVSGSVELITGSSDQELVLDSSLRTALLALNIEEGICYDKIVIRLTDVPDYLTYKYGINPNDLNTPNYLSTLDTNENAYYFNGIIATYEEMAWVGREIGSSMGSVEVKFISTSGGYKHTFSIIHEFTIPYYVQSDSTNINEVKNPTNLQSVNSLKYGNGFFFGYKRNNTTLVFEDTGKIGSVGYFDENFSGRLSDFSVSNYQVVNPSRTEGIEATEVNTITFSIVSTSATGFVGGERIVINHSILPLSQDYSRQKESFDETWLFENLEVTEGAIAVNGTIIKNATATFNAISGELDVSFTTEYTTDQQDKMSTNIQALVYVTLATDNLLDAEKQNKSNLKITTGTVTKFEELDGLVTLWQPYIHEQWDSKTLVKNFTNFDGYNGDLLFQTGKFELDLSKDARVKSIIFKVVVDDGADNFKEFELPIQVNPIVTTDIGGTDYQVLNIKQKLGFNFDENNAINRFIMDADLPLVAGATQLFSFSVGFNVPWREWIENLSVPTSFIDINEPNNNRNERSSNYSGVGSYDIKTSLQLGIATPRKTGGTLVSNYELLSDASRIIDYDTANAGFSTGVVNFYNYLNVLSTDIDSHLDGRIEIEFTHSLGTIPVGDIAGYIEIEIADSNIQPFYLSTDIDLNDPNNPLTPSDTLLSGNTQFVEVVSTLNSVKFICNTNSDNIEDGTSYNIYGRISNKV